MADDPARWRSAYDLRLDSLFISNPSTHAAAAVARSLAVTGMFMGQLRTANNRRKRAILADQRRASIHPVDRDTHTQTLRASLREMPVLDLER